MPMSYRMYIERRKALDEDCAYTEKQFAMATDRWKQAGSDKIKAEENLDHGSEELRGARESDLLEKSDRLDAAVMELKGATEERDRARAARNEIASDYPPFEAAAKEGISPTDEHAPADLTTRRERIGEFMGQTKDVIDTGLMAGGLIAQIATATPDVHAPTTPPATIEQLQQEASRQAISLDEHQTQVYEVRASAVPGQDTPDVDEMKSKKERDADHETEHQQELKEGREKEEEKRSLESQVEALGDQEHMTSAGDLKEKNEKLIAETARPRGIPDPDKPLEMPARTGSGPGIPDPDRPAPALAAAPPAPANDNNPRSPANDNNPSL